MTDDIPLQVELETAACPLGCPSVDDAVLQGGDRLTGLPGTYRIVRCRTCGLMRTNPRPTPETIGFYYPESYGPYVSTQVSERPERPRWQRALRSMFQLNAQRLPELPPGRVLEIGCASGAFLHQLAQEGWVAEGVEPSAKAAEAARALGYRVHTGPLETAPEPEHPYDLIVGWMVLEHLHDPVGALRNLHRWTKPGGWLAVSVPNAGSYEFRLFRDAWYALQLPTHLFHYTTRTLRTVMQHTGWRVRRVFHQRTLANVVASAGYRMADARPDSSVARALIDYPDRRGYGDVLLYPVAGAIAALQQGGRMTVWAQRE